QVSRQAMICTGLTSLGRSTVAPPPALSLQCVTIRPLGLDPGMDRQEGHLVKPRRKFVAPIRALGFAHRSLLRPRARFRRLAGVVERSAGSGEATGDHG